MESTKNLSIENLKMERDAAIRAKDDLVAQLRILKKKLQEAEEEQYKAEEDAAALRSELESLQRREEYRNMMSSSSTSEQYRLLEQELATSKLDLQNAIQQWQQEQYRVLEEQRRVSDLLAEQEQLKNALSEAQKRVEEVGKSSSVNTVKDHQLRELASMVERLESGRQKLLAEIDSQSAEIERLFMENDSLKSYLKEASSVTGQWENQVKECLQQNAKLRLELNELREKRVTEFAHVKNSVMDENENFKLQLELANTKGQTETLSAQVLQLSSELKHAMQYINSLNWLYRPVLAKIENRLLHLKQHGNNITLPTFVQ